MKNLPLCFTYFLLLTNVNKVGDFLWPSQNIWTLRVYFSVNGPSEIIFKNQPAPTKGFLTLLGFMFSRNKWSRERLNFILMNFSSVFYKQSVYCLENILNFNLPFYHFYSIYSLLDRREGVARMIRQRKNNRSGKINPLCFFQQWSSAGNIMFCKSNWDEAQGFVVSS